MAKFGNFKCVTVRVVIWFEGCWNISSALGVSNHQTVFSKKGLMCISTLAEFDKQTYIF